MRSIFFKILAWFGVLLLFSFAAMFVTTSMVMRDYRPMDRFAGRGFDPKLEDAIAAYQSGGKEALAAALARMDRYSPGQHHLLDSTGRDLITGTDYSSQARAPRPGAPPGRPFLGPPSRGGAWRGVSADGQFQLFMEWRQPEFEPPNLLPYYTWIVVALCLLCYALAFTFIRPLRQLRETLWRFGSGDLAARTNSRRRDEFGDLSRAFDKMADRIQTLLTAERRLLQDVSHELRSPLARLGFAVELARSGTDKPAAFIQIKKDMDRISGLVGELIEMTRAEGDPGERRLVPVDLEALIGSVAADCLFESDAKACRIVRRVGEPLTVAGNEELLRRAVENVLRNAVGHAPNGSGVEIELRREKDSAVIIVRDRGPGVPEEMLSDIFRPFFRVESDRARDSGGVGLGLAIAQRAVSLHHGRIVAENQNPGLRVSIHLPLQPAHS